LEQQLFWHREKQKEKRRLFKVTILKQKILEKPFQKCNSLPPTPQKNCQKTSRIAPLYFLLLCFFNIFPKHRCTQGGRGEGEEGGTSCTPLKCFQKLDHKNAKK
jgi:hypothetical protein